LKFIKNLSLYSGAFVVTFYALVVLLIV